MKKFLAVITIMAMMTGTMAVFADTLRSSSGVSGENTEVLRSTTTVAPLPATVKNDRFNVSEEWGGKLISADGELIIHVSDETVIELEDGTPFVKEAGDTWEKTLNNRNLIVEYSIVTMSIPPQTSPLKITVLFEEAVPPIFEMPAAPILEVDQAELLPQSFGIPKFHC